jgi:hypothetical protein
MAQKRMFSHEIVSSDAFLDMPVSTQLLYFHLGMAADDDGFVNPKRIMRTVGVSDDDLKVLIAKRFLLPFESGVVVIKHWLIHNLVRADLYKETSYRKEKSQIGLNDSGAYTEMREGVAELKAPEPPKWLKERRAAMRTANVPQTALRLGKDRIEKTSAERRNYGDLNNVRLSEQEYQKLTARYGASATRKLIGELSTYMASKGKAYSDHYATLLNWAKRKGIEEVKAVPVAVQDETLTPEQIEANKRRLAGVREVLASKMKM